MQQTQLQPSHKDNPSEFTEGNKMVQQKDKSKASIGVNLRVTGHCQQGGRKYMEDYFAVAYQQTDDEKDLEYAFFGIFDGHGGAEAAAFAKEHLMEFIVKDHRFWQDDDAEVLQSIKDGFLDTHQAMWRIHEHWPKTASGLPSTAGTTASVAFIRRGKIYIGHVGDSGITLGYQPPGSHEWLAKPLTKDHKPESEAELARIEQSGGKVISKMGVPRVVWNRPRIGHKGPVRRSTPIDEIPFLAVARSLGDLWSYNASNDEFVVSPKPDVAVIPIDTSTFRCLIFGTDGLYNMLTPQIAVHIVQDAERKNEEATLNSPNPQWINPSKTLVERALDRWCNTKMRADNTSVITLMLDPPGPPRAQVLRNQRIERERLASLNHKHETSSTDMHPNRELSYDANQEESSNIRINHISKNSEKKTLEQEKSFVPKLRESIPFDPRTTSLSPGPSTTPKDKEIDNENEQSKIVDDDIQIHEISSSEDESKKKRKVGRPNKLSIVHLNQRKINLRSNNLEESKKSKKEDKRKSSEGAVRSPLGENVPETSRISSCGSSESRVLRERRNTTPNNQEKRFKKATSSKKKMSLSNDKKKLLQNLLFKNKDESSISTRTRSTSPPKTKENLRKSSPKATQSNSNSSQRRSERTKASESPREMRKSTIKLRIHEGLFKAKLRTSQKLKLTKKKTKELSLKNYPAS